MSENISKHDSDRSPIPRVTWDGCSILPDINDGDRLVFACLSGGAKLKIGNKNYSLQQPLIGAPFGSLFQVENGTEGSCLSRVVPTKQESNNHEGDGLVTDQTRDNPEIVDNNEAQSLTGEELEAMREL